MKTYIQSTLITFFLLCIYEMTSAQQTLSYIYKNTPSEETQLKGLFKERNIQRIKLDEKRGRYESDSLQDQKDYVKRKHLLEQDIDSMNTAQGNLDNIQKKIESLGGEKIYFYGNAAITSSQDLVTDASGSGKLSVFINLGNNFYGAIAYNKIGIKPSSISEDSLDANSIMFPDAGNTGFISSLCYTPIIRNNGNNSVVSRMNFTLEFSLKQTAVKTSVESETIDSAGVVQPTIEISNYSFTSLNYHLGVGYLWTYIPKEKENTVQVGLGVYYHVLNIPDEDEQYFGDIFNDSALIANNDSHIHSFGGKITFQYKGLTFYADVRENFKKNLMSVDPFAGTVYNIGTLVSAEIFKR